jgi:hypothetical protein
VWGWVWCRTAPAAAAVGWYLHQKQH